MRLSINDKEKIWYSVGYLCQRLGLNQLNENSSDAVLTFHSVGDGFYDNITPKEFEQLIEYLSLKYRIVDLEVLLETYSDDKRIAITFDDGYIGFHDYVVPILSERNVPATVFIIARSLFDDDFQHNDDYEYEYMTTGELQEIQNVDEIVIGNHTLTHPNLTKISDTRRLYKEIQGGKERLESELGITVDRFCYPGNMYNSQCYGIVKETHKYAVCGRGRNSGVSPDTDFHLVPRINGAKPFWKVAWDMSDLSTSLANIIR